MSCRIPNTVNPPAASNAKSTSGVVKSKSTQTSALGSRDIIFGRGKETHSGNQHFREVCSSFSKIYESMPNNSLKQDIVNQIYNKLLVERYRFVERGNLSHVVDKDKICEKIRQRIKDSNKEKKKPITDSQISATSAGGSNSNSTANHHTFLLLEPASWLVESRINQVLKSNVHDDLAQREAFELGFHDGRMILESYDDGGTIEQGESLCLDTTVGEAKFKKSPRSVMRKTSSFESVDLQM